jgi:hypothetical protein
MSEKIFLLDGVANVFQHSTSLDEFSKTFSSEMNIDEVSVEACAPGIINKTEFVLWNGGHVGFVDRKPS